MSVAEFYRGTRVVVTGGVGFIGSNLALRLVELGAEVMLIDSMLPAYGATLDNIAPVRDRLQLNFSDVRDRHSLNYLVQNREVIFSLAGQISHSESMRDPMTDLEINCRSQLSLLECCRRTVRPAADVAGREPRSVRRGPGEPLPGPWGTIPVGQCGVRRGSQAVTDAEALGSVQIRIHRERRCRLSNLRARARITSCFGASRRSAG